MHFDLASPVSAPAPDSLGDTETLEFGHIPLRIRQAAILRGLGHSFREIGERLQITPQAVSLMLARYRGQAQRRKNARGSLASLSTRAVNALGRHGIHTAEQARAAGVPGLLKNERNCGRKTLEEIRRWMDASASTPIPTN